jgi:hypothetical protein
METATLANRKLRLAALLYILRRKRHRSIQRKKLYLRMSSVLLNTSILEIYGLWKSGEIVLLTNRSQLTNRSLDLWPLSLKAKRNCIDDKSLKIMNKLIIKKCSTFDPC